MAAQVVTHTAGSSAWFERGFVTYSNAAKRELLNVAERILAEHGAVSEATAAAMATGALANSHADIALAITGIAGPAGGSEHKPVGLVCFAWARRAQPLAEPPAPLAPLVEQRHFQGDREAIRRQATMHALHGVLRLLEAAR